MAIYFRSYTPGRPGLRSSISTIAASSATLARSSTHRREDSATDPKRRPGGPRYEGGIRPPIRSAGREACGTNAFPQVFGTPMLVAVRRAEHSGYAEHLRRHLYGSIWRSLSARLRRAVRAFDRVSELSPRHRESLPGDQPIDGRIRPPIRSAGREAYDTKAERGACVTMRG